MRCSKLLASNTAASILSAALWSGAVVSMGEVLSAFVGLCDFVAGNDACAQSDRNDVVKVGMRLSHLTTMMAIAAGGGGNDA